MDLTPQTTIAIFIVIILVVFLVILYVCNSMLNKKEQKIQDCNCSVPRNKIIEQLDNTEKQEKNVDQDIGKNKLCLYYTDWCGYSRQFLPEWEKLKSKILSSDLKTEIETKEFECDKNKQQCQEENIRGFPTIILHKANGKKIQYNNERTSEAIINFCKSEI